MNYCKLISVGGYVPKLIYTEEYEAHFKELYKVVSRLMPNKSIIKPSI